MHRIDTPTAQKDKFGQGKNGFTNGDPTTGTPSTKLNSDLYDALQEEVCTVVERSGIRLDKSQHDQLYQAVKKLSEAEANKAKNALIDGSPIDLNTLNKIAKALGNDTKFSETVINLLNQKLAKNQNGADIPDKNLFLKNLGLLELTINTLYPVGIVAFFAQNKNPNTLFDGTTWQYIGENKTIRLAKADGSNVLTMGGSDSIKLTEAQIPVHAHTFSGKTSSFDYGTKKTNTTDNHVHSVNTVGDEYKQVRSGDHFSVKTRAVPENTSPSGSHYHTTYLGPHDHTVSGSTDNIGSGSAINITNAFVTLMGWYRTY